MTAIGHFSVLSQTTYNPSIITFVMSLSGTQPLQLTDFAQLWKDRGMMERHERFHQKLSPTASGYFLPTVRSQQFQNDDTHPVQDHLQETIFPTGGKADVLARMKYMQTTQWDLTESLWRIWIAPWGPLGGSGCFAAEDVEEETASSPKGESLLFFQGHHALADGASMTAAFLDVVDEAEELRQDILNFLRQRRE